MNNIRPLKSKDAELILDHLKDFAASLKNITGKSIVTLRSDKDPEYHNSLMQQFTSVNGIRHEFANDGFVERRHCDNLPAIKHSSNLENDSTAWHISLRIHFIRDLLENKVIELHHARSKFNQTMTRVVSTPAWVEREAVNLVSKLEGLLVFYLK